MIILDSNIWIAFLHKKDNQNKKAEKIITSLSGGIAITEYIILEVSSVLAIKAGKNIADKFIEFVLDNSDIQLLLSNNNFFHDTIRLFVKMRNDKLSFVDVSLLNLSNVYNIITFDQNLEESISKFLKSNGKSFN